MSYSKVKLSFDGEVAIVTMADPGTLNSVDAGMGEEMADAFDVASREARCVVLTGEGRGFCSGFNLSAGVEMDDNGVPDVGAVLQLVFNPFVKKLADLPIPFVTAVNGAAAGIGCSFALLGDIIIASESAYFLQAFRRIGLVPDGGSTYILPRMLTRARAMEMMLLGDKLPAKKALEWGLINDVVADADLMGKALGMAQALASGPTRTLGMIRQLAWSANDATFSEQLLAERVVQRQAGLGPDFAEGVTAFHQKRPAQFTKG